VKRHPRVQAAVAERVGIIVLYARLRENRQTEMTPRTFFFAGKAAPAYRLAK